MRIVGGAWRGRELKAPRGRDATRPTTDRVRESCASAILSACDLDLSRAQVLDAFAGSGAMGFELLSRGAAGVTFVDRGREQVACVRENGSSLGAPAQRCRVIQGDVFALARSGRLPGGPFAVVVLDPPYAMPAEDVAALVCDLAERGILGGGALVLYERALSGPRLPLERATVLKEKRFGSTCVELYRLEEDDHAE